MRKYLVLTSILALTACGGGSGSGGHGGNSTDITQPVQDTETSISSINLSDLANVDFSGGDDTTYNFIVENGVIAAFESDGQRYNIMDGNKYIGTYEGEDFTETELGIIELLGGENNLKYSDFGYLQRLGYETNGTFTSDGNAEIIAGGIKKYEITQPTEEMTFTGTAVAALTAYSGSNSAPSAMISKTNDAVLTFDGQTEHLTMNFSKADNAWYDVSIIGNVAKISSANEAHIDSKYRMSQTEFDLANTDINTTYYGAENQVSEVISTAKFRDGSVSVETAFGGTK